VWFCAISPRHAHEDRGHLYHTQSHHAYPIGDHFTILNRGSSYGTFAKSEISREELTGMMAEAKLWRVEPRTGRVRTHG